MAEPSTSRLSNRAILVACVVGVSAMVGAAYAAVPLYRAFCQATGFNGTVRRAEAAHFTPIARQLTVRFDTNVRGLPWDFAPEQTLQTVQIGKPGLAYFKVTNHGAQPITGRAVYSLTPESASPYFVKTQCFCFNEQTVAAGTTVSFPVIYYVDPDFASDVETRGYKELTLSYTFYPAAQRGPGSSPS